MDILLLSVFSLGCLSFSCLGPCLVIFFLDSNHGHLKHYTASRSYLPPERYFLLTFDTFFLH